MNILLTSVGRRTYMVKYFQKALKSIGKVHAANSVLTHTMEVADAKIVTPQIFDSSYIDFLISYCKKNSIKAIIPLFDIDLPILAKNKHRFLKDGIELIVSDFDTIEICNDKWKTYKFLQDNQFNAPISFIDIDKFKLALDNKSLQFPVIIKPRWGMGSIGIFEAENIYELNVLYNKVKKSILNSYLIFESETDIEHAIIIQEKLNGQEYGLDLFNDLSGNFLNCIPKKKIAMRAGETDSAIIIENKKLFDLGVKLSEKLKHNANLDVDCFKIGDEYYILELNCRFGGQYPFSHIGGANFPKAIVNMLLKNEVPKDFLTAKTGVTGVKEINPIIYEKN